MINWIADNAAHYVAKNYASYLDIAPDNALIV